MCGSYAYTFQLLAARAGLETRVVTGDVGSVGHAWNIVQIDGTWKNVDATYGDALPKIADQFLLVP